MTKKLPEDGQSGHYASEDYAKFLSTFDLGAAASLVSAGFELVSLDKANPRKVQFSFRREDGIEKVLDSYWADRLEVKARTLFDNVKMLKNRIYSE